MSTRPVLNWVEGACIELAEVGGATTGENPMGEYCSLGLCTWGTPTRG